MVGVLGFWGAVHRGQAFFRLHHNQPIHAIGDVMRDHWGGAVVHVQAGVGGLERELRAVAGRGERRRRAAARAGDRVQVDVVRHLVVGVVVEVELDRVPLPHPHEASGDVAAVGPEHVVKWLNADKNYSLVENSSLI